MTPKLPRILSLSQLLQLLGVSKQAVGEHVQAGVIRKVGDNAYDIKSVPAYIARLRKIAAEGGGMSPQRERLLRARARRAELEVAKLEGKLVPADEIEMVWLRQLGAIKQQFLAIPSKSADQLTRATTSQQCFEIVMCYVRDALTTASETEIIEDGND
jgi:phage terminase Nu1 subunit (DNA packaging protein)